MDEGELTEENHLLKRKLKRKENKIRQSDRRIRYLEDSLSKEKWKCFKLDDALIALKSHGQIALRKEQCCLLEMLN